MHIHQEHKTYENSRISSRRELLWHLRFYQRCYRTYRSCGMWRRVAVKVFFDVSKGSSSRDSLSKKNSSCISWPLNLVTLSEIVGWTEFFRVLGYYAAYGGLKQFRNYLSVPSSRAKLSEKKAWHLKMVSQVFPKRWFKTTLRRVIIQRRKNLVTSSPKRRQPITHTTVSHPWRLESSLVSLIKYNV